MPSSSLSRKNLYLCRHYGNERTGLLPFVDLSAPGLAPVSASMVPDALISYADIPKRKPRPPRDPSVRYGVHFLWDTILNVDNLRAVAFVGDYAGFIVGESVVQEFAHFCISDGRSFTPESHRNEMSVSPRS